MTNLSVLCCHRNRLLRDISIGRVCGFTLIELMVVIVIVAILLTIALPTYQNFMFRTRRTDGKNLLQQIAAAEEKYFTNKNAYTNDMSSTGLSVSAIAASVTSPKGYYKVTVNGLGASSLTYTLNAAPQGAQATDLCGTLTLTSTGVKGPTTAATNTNGTCL